ncbi:MAG: hypothetical protein J6P21_01475 [Clostridia bacterium]|nr:hypothetical protein [Clostridia bacterium]
MVPSAQAQDLNKNQIAKADGFNINGTNSVQNSGKLGRVTGKTKSIDWKKVGKIGGITVGGLVGLEGIHSIFGFTNLTVGKGSLGRWIKEHGKKDDHQQQLPDRGRWTQNLIRKNC